MGAEQHLLKITPSGEALVTGSIAVEVTVADYISVTPSGIFYTTVTASGAALPVSGNLGVIFDPTDTLSVTPSGVFEVETNLYAGSEVWQGTDPWIVLGSQRVTNFPTAYPGSVVITNDPVPVSGNLGVIFDPTDTLSVTPSGVFEVETNLYAGSEVWQGTDPWIVLGSQQVTNFPTHYPGSVFQATDPWIVLGSMAVTTNPLPVSGERAFYDANEQITDIIGSPTATDHVFSSVVKTLIIKPQVSCYVAFDSTADSDSFIVSAGDTLSADFKVGSVNTLYIDSVGSIWIWGGR